MSIDPKDERIEHEAEVIDLTASRRAPAPDIPGRRTSRR